MTKQVLFRLAICLVSTAYSQSINVSGTIKDAANKPIANAIVELLQAKAKDTTGADGAYALKVTTSATRRAVLSSPGSVNLQKGILELTTAQADLIRIEIFDVKGNLLDRLVREMVPAGTYRLNLAGRVSSRNLVLVKASVGRMIKTIPYFPMGLAATPATVSPEITAQAGAPLARMLAVLDTLQVSASGFATKRVEVNSAEATLDVTLESSTDKWGGLKNPPGKSAGCGKASNIKSATRTIMSGGTQRSYLIDVPADYDPAKPYRLFVCSHGQGSTLNNIIQSNYYDIKTRSTAAKEPVILVAGLGYANGSSGAWGQVDHAFFDDLTNFVKDNLCVDTTRIFVTGMSMGGMHSYSLTTTRAHKIRAGVGLAPANYNIWLPTVKQTIPIAWMQTTGMSDNTTPWVSNEAQKRGSKFIALEKAANNGCTIPAEIPTWKSGAHICYDFQGCKPGYPVKVCTFNGGHNNTNSDPGSSVNWIGVESWKFFTQF